MREIEPGEAFDRECPLPDLPAPLTLDTREA